MKGQNFIGKVMKITAVVFEKKEGGIDVGFQKEEESIVVGVEKLGGPFVGDKGGGRRTFCRRWKCCTFGGLIL